MKRMVMVRFLFCSLGLCLVELCSLEGYGQTDSIQFQIKAGDLSKEVLTTLMKRAEFKKDDSTEQKIARYYLDKYGRGITGSSDQDVTTIKFLCNHLDVLTTRDSLFHFIYYHGDLFDSIVASPKYSDLVIRVIIHREELDGPISRAMKDGNGEPDWVGLHQRIAKKFNGHYAGEVILYAQIGWYRKKKDYRNLATYIVKKLDLFGLDSTDYGRGYVNNDLFGVVFMYSTNRDVLQKAARYMRVIVDGAPNDAAYIDTYANLLYKSGDVQKAMTWESKAAQLSARKDIQDCYARMKAGLPTW